MSGQILIPHSRPWISESDFQAVQNVLQSGMLSQGLLTAKLESEICRYVGSRYGVAQPSGTAALVLALKALKIGCGDEVILPTYVCRNVLDAVISVGACGKLCDVNDNGVITLESVSTALSPRCKAIIAVHIFGHPCDVGQIKTLGLPIIEDACQAFGMEFEGKMAGTVGDVGILSFHATKSLTTGEGGMLLTNDETVETNVRRLVRVNDDGVLRGVVTFSDLQAALGLSQFARYTEFRARRQVLAKEYLQVAQSVGISIGMDNASSLPFRFTLRLSENFEALAKIFLHKGVVIRRGVDELLHRGIGLDDASFPNATRLFETTISLPFYPGLTDGEASIVKETIKTLKLSNYGNRN